MESDNPPFTLTIDWLGFTLPKSSVDQVTRTIGGDWVQSEGGFRGYPHCWIDTGSAGGVGKLGTGAPRKPLEVHVDLSAGIVSTWPLDKVHRTLAWIFEQDGHLTRLDCALDDRQGLVPLSLVKQAIEAGHCLCRAEHFDVRHGANLDTGEVKGETLYIGSPASQTLLRIYDKRLELKAKSWAHWQDYGNRWELQLKKERATAMGLALRVLPQEEWRRYVVGVLRSFINFRDTTRGAPSWERARAALLPWWAELTEGFERCQLTVEKPARSLEEVKSWVSRSLAPTLAALRAAPGAGPAWLDKVIRNGSDRWKAKHYRLLQRKPPERTYRLKPSGPDSGTA